MWFKQIVEQYIRPYKNVWGYILIIGILMGCSASYYISKNNTTIEQISTELMEWKQINSRTYGYLKLAKKRDSDIDSNDKLENLLDDSYKLIQEWQDRFQQGDYYVSDLEIILYNNFLSMTTLPERVVPPIAR